MKRETPTRARDTAAVEAARREVDSAADHLLANPDSDEAKARYQAAIAAMRVYGR